MLTEVAEPKSFRLTPATMKLLDKVCKEHRRKRANMIEMLIINEAERLKIKTHK